MYDLIGDIHGYAEPLKQLLYKMDYKEDGGVWKHKTRKAVFVGDYIDRGPSIQETLSLIKSMVDNKSAIALMGNHEYNALAYHFKEGDDYLRAHNKNHDHQHQATLDQFKGHEKEWHSYLEWFYTLKLFIDEDFRAVHACWDQMHIDWLKMKGWHTMNKELLIGSHQKGTKDYEVINDILKGKEFVIPEQYAWKDKDGQARSENRIKWWKEPSAVCYGDYLFDCPPALREEKVEPKEEIIVYPKNDPPVFFGHYWLEDSYPVIQTDNVVCLDYSIAKGGSLVAYRWNGEGKVDSAHFASVSYS